MLSNRRSILGPVSTGDKVQQDRVSVCNPKPAWRRASSFNVANSTGAYHTESAPPQYNTNNDHPHCSTPSVPTSTTHKVPGYNVKRTIGTIHGTTTGALPKDGVKLWIKSVCGMGAEVRNLTNLIYSMRDVAMERMVLDCVSRGGNAVVGLSYTESEMMGCVTVSIQGTAVYVEGQMKGIREGNPFEGS